MAFIIPKEIRMNFQKKMLRKTHNLLLEKSIKKKRKLLTRGLIEEVAEGTAKWIAEAITDKVSMQFEKKCHIN